MTLYDFNGALLHYGRIQTGKSAPMTDGQYDEAVARLRELNLPDVRV